MGVGREHSQLATMAPHRLLPRAEREGPGGASLLVTHA